MPENDRGEYKTEQEPNDSYCQVARFTDEQIGLAAYWAVQEALLADVTCDLSSYRFFLNALSHVAVIGTQPSNELDQQLARLLAAGEPTTLPSAVLTLLRERRALAGKRGTWVEGHYRPGKPVRRPDDLP